MNNEEQLREILWYHHGCESPCLYGDDGEMQCNANKHLPHPIDFKRDSPEMLMWKLAGDEYRRLVPMPEDIALRMRMEEGH